MVFWTVWDLLFQQHDILVSGVHTLYTSQETGAVASSEEIYEAEEDAEEPSKIVQKGRDHVGFSMAFWCLFVSASSWRYRSGSCVILQISLDVFVT